MTDLIPFTFEDEAVRAVMIGDDPWWVANDVARVLGYRDAPNMTRMLDDDEKGTHIVSSGRNTQREPANPQTLTIINESGLFAVTLKSRKPEARRFRRWVTGEVLPALRRHGSYHLPGLNDADTEIVGLDSARLSASIAAVREARRLFGPQSARVIWSRLGLPAPLAGSIAEVPSDPLAPDVQAYLDTVQSTTIDQTAEAVGINIVDGGTRLRIGALLRLFGWFPRKARQGKRVVNLFTPRPLEV